MLFSHRCIWLVLNVAILCLAVCKVSAREKLCTYTTYQWNVDRKKAVNFKTVKHPYSALDDYEFDPVTGCSVCEEDQTIVKISNLPPFKICKHLAGDIYYQLSQLLNSDEPLNKVVGYRVGMTRGDVDETGNRTQFSNHSFGIALDINDEQNGLYDHCYVFGSQCRLRKGGTWDPNHPASLTENSSIVLTMKRIGFKWGGEIKGQQKDFMHFSPSGY